MRTRFLYPLICILMAAGLYVLNVEAPFAAKSTQAVLATTGQPEVATTWYAPDAVTAQNNNAWASWGSWQH